MTCQVPVNCVGSVGMCVEVHHSNSTESILFCNSCGRRPRNGVVATNHNRSDACIHDVCDFCFHIVKTLFHSPVWTKRITSVNYFQVIKNLYSKIEMKGAWLIRLRPHSARTKPRARAICGAEIKRCAHDGNIWLPLPELLSIGHKRPLRKSRQAAKHVSKIELLLVAGRKFTPWFSHSESVIRGVLVTSRIVAPFILCPVLTQLASNKI